MKALDSLLNGSHGGRHFAYLVVRPMENKSTRIGIFLGVSWLYACIHLDRQALGILAESVKSDLHLTDQQLGTLTGSAFAIVYALLGLHFGALADRSNRLRLVCTGAWVWSLSCIAAGFAPNYSLLVASRAGVAVGEAIATSAAVAVIAELAGLRYRARVASFFLTSAFLGAGVAAICGGAIVDVFRGSMVPGWRAALMVAGVPGLMGALYLSFFREQAVGHRACAQPHPDASNLGLPAGLIAASLAAVLIQMVCPPIVSVPLCVLVALALAARWVRKLRQYDPAAYRDTVGQPAFRLVIIAFAAVMFVDYAAAFWLLPFAQRQFGLAAGTAGAQLGGLLLVGGIGGCLFGGWLADYWRRLDMAGRAWTALIAVLAEGAAILLALGQGSYPVFLASFGLFCVAGGGWVGVAAALAFDIVPPDRRGTGTAVYFLATTLLGPALGPFVVGLGSDLTGSIRIGLGAACALILVSAGALLCLARVLRSARSMQVVPP